MYITAYQINKPKIVQFLKFKFLTIIKLNLMGVNFIKIYIYNLVISNSEKKVIKNCKV